MIIILMLYITWVIINKMNSRKFFKYADVKLKAEGLTESEIITLRAAMSGMQ